MNEENVVKEEKNQTESFFTENEYLSIIPEEQTAELQSKVTNSKKQSLNLFQSQFKSKD